ncbi:MAG: peptide ABC transporter substrate-binding protein [Candidatus Dormibacteraeota bacterium]|nr:peptide ABC transporter substrate-binding protein [Candidatus Dormibacteraeota bacterium]MBV9526500.1 peptide ABC transporter substrate-binding protein [Candidatus Dormibacteraeota bacterium]
MTPLLVLAACGGGSGGGNQSNTLASSQVLHFPVLQDPSTWDPGVSQLEVESEIIQNVFDNLWRFDDKLNLVPDIAAGVPTIANGGISADGQTYTVHLKHNVKFSNGDALTSKDVLYSWNRGVILRGAYASNMSAIAGYSDVRKAAAAFCSKNASVATCRSSAEQHLAALDPAFMMKGLTAPDPYTVVINTPGGCGWCLTAWSLQSTTGAILDENVIKNDPVNWWSKPGEQVGTGAYMLTSYTPKQSTVFKQVPNWWGTPRPTLTEIDIDIKDPSTQTTNDAAWEQGSYDLIGYGGDSQQPQADILRYEQSGQFKSQVSLIPKGRTTWLSFNVGYPSTGGPFVGESAAAKGLRMAFALAVDKNALAATVCHNLSCTAATGGLITTGLIGHLGAGSDPLAKFDPTQAKSLLHQYDPDGTKTANLKYSYNAGGLNDPVATFLQGQWQTNLGVNVALDPHPDASAFLQDRLAGKFVMARDGWQFDYNHPQDWFDNLWGTSACGANTSGFADNGSCGDGATDSNPTYDNTLAKADTLPIDQALPLYNQLSQLLISDVAYIPLYYSVGEFMIHSWVKGAGSNAQADFYWNEISILQH